MDHYGSYSSNCLTMATDDHLQTWNCIKFKMGKIEMVHNSMAIETLHIQRWLCVYGVWRILFLLELGVCISQSLVVTSY